MVCRLGVSRRAGLTGLAGHGAICLLAVFDLVSWVGLVGGSSPVSGGEGCGRIGLVGRMDLASGCMASVCELPAAGGVPARGLGWRLGVGPFGHWGRRLGWLAVAGAVGWCGNVAVHP